MPGKYIDGFVRDPVSGALYVSGDGLGGSGGAVASVNGQTGTIVLTASDVGAATAADVATLSTTISGKADASALASKADAATTASALASKATAQTVTTRTVSLRPTLADADTAQYFDPSDATRGYTLWVPNDSVVNFRAGTEIPIEAEGTQGVLVTPDFGVLILGPDGTYGDTLWTVSGSAVLKKFATNRWRLAGHRAPTKYLETFRVSSNTYSTGTTQTADMGGLYGATRDWERHTLMSSSGATANLTGSQTGAAGQGGVGNGALTTYHRFGRLLPTYNMRAVMDFGWATDFQTAALALHLDPVQATCYDFIFLTATTYDLRRRSNTGGATTNAAVSLTGGTKTLTGSDIAVVGDPLKRLEITCVKNVSGNPVFNVWWGGVKLLTDIVDTTPLALGYGGIRGVGSTNHRFDNFMLESIVA